MKLSYLVFNLCMFSTLLSKCTKPYERKEIRELSENERQKLFSAMRKLATRDPFSKDKLSKYEKFARIHNKADKFAHGRPAFYPWHRIYLRYFEMELQRIDPDVHLAYWDWSYDSKHPEKSEIFDYLGGNGDPDNDYVLSSGPFNYTYYEYPKPHYLVRKFDEGGDGDNSISRFASPEQVLVALNEKKYSFFGHLMERYHGDPHMSIGDSPSDFSTMYSPLDPIFYFHHTFIDMIWWQWQQRHKDADQYDGARYRERNTFPYERMYPFLLKAQDTFDTTSDFFCYTYPNYPTEFKTKDKSGRSIQLPSAFKNPLLSTFLNLTMDDIINKVDSVTQGRSLSPFNKEKIKKLKPINRKWIEAEGLDEDDVRETEQKVERFTDALNNLPFFVPLGKEE